MRRRGQSLTGHLAYLRRTVAEADRERSDFFDREGDHLPGARVTSPWVDDHRHYRFIVSPEHGDRIADLKGYVRELMARVGADLREPNLTWIATCHYDTAHPHAHVLVRGRREDGRDLFIPWRYMARGVRAHAQEIAHAWLGELTRIAPEQQLWRETQAFRFTAVDRRLLAQRDETGCVSDGMGISTTWAALARGRLRRLEALGLARRNGPRFRLDDALEQKLRILQLRQTLIREDHERRLADRAGLAVSRPERAQARHSAFSRGLEGRDREDLTGAEPPSGASGETGLQRRARAATSSREALLAEVIGARLAGDLAC